MKIGLKVSMVNMIFVLMCCFWPLVTSNTPPNFPPSVSQTIENGGTNILVTLKASDPDSADVLTWTILPNTYKSKFALNSISRTDANIIRLTDLSEVCEQQITLLLTVTDNVNPAVGTATITITIDNAVPEVTSLNKELTWQENRQFYSYFKGINVGGDRGTCIVTSDPGKYASELHLGGCSSTSHSPYIIQTSGRGYDFENDPPVNYTLVYKKGKCSAQPVWLHVTWKDVNDKPKLILNKDSYTFNEGVVNFLPEYEASDDEDGKEIRFQFAEPDSAGPFNIDPNTGRIYSTTTIKTDGKDSVTKELKVFVTDTTQLKSDIKTITIIIEKQLTSKVSQQTSRLLTTTTKLSTTFVETTTQNIPIITKNTEETASVPLFPTTEVARGNMLEDPLNITLLTIGGLLGLIALFGALSILIRCCCRCCWQCYTRPSVVHPQKVRSINLNNGIDTDYLYVKHYVKGDNESGVYSIPGEEIFERRGSNYSTSMGQYRMNNRSNNSSREFGLSRMFRDGLDF